VTFALGTSALPVRSRRCTAQQVQCCLAPAKANGRSPPICHSVKQNAPRAFQARQSCPHVGRDWVRVWLSRLVSICQVPTQQHIRGFIQGSAADLFGQPVSLNSPKPDRDRIRRTRSRSANAKGPGASGSPGAARRYAERRAHWDGNEKVVPETAGQHTNASRRPV